MVDFTRDGEPWLGILKLNYKNGYTHYTENVEGAPVNSIIQQRACLPSQSGKVEDCLLYTSPTGRASRTVWRPKSRTARQLSWPH